MSGNTRLVGLLCKYLLLYTVSYNLLPCEQAKACHIIRANQTCTVCSLFTASYCHWCHRESHRLFFTLYCNSVAPSHHQCQSLERNFTVSDNGWRRCLSSVQCNGKAAKLTLACVNRALAKHSSCFCPAEKNLPLSPTSASRPPDIHENIHKRHERQHESVIIYIFM